MFKKKSSPRNLKLPGLRGLLSRHRAVTSPVDNRNPTAAFLTASCSEPDLTIHDSVDGFGESELCPINTLALRHVKSDGFSSNEYLEEPEMCQLQQFSLSSSLNSNRSLEAGTDAQDETDFVPQFLLRGNLGQHVKSANNVLNGSQCVRRRDLYGRPRPLSSPDIAGPLPITHNAGSSEIEAAYTKTPSSEGVKLASRSQSDLSEIRKEQQVTQKTSPFLNLHKSFASAWKIFRPNSPKNKRQSSAQETPPPSFTRQDTTTTLAQYCEKQELELTSSGNSEFCVIPTSTASAQLLAHQRKRSESELERVEVMEVAVTHLEAHTHEHLQWTERKLRTTSMWSTSGVILPPANPYEIQFECEVLHYVVCVWEAHINSQLG